MRECYHSTDMKNLRLLAVVLAVMSVPILLITTNVRWVINAPVLYSYGFDRYDIPTYTGLERGELLSAARQIRDYFNNDEEFLSVRVVLRGVPVNNLFLQEVNTPLRVEYIGIDGPGPGNDREVLHMKDVKRLVRGVYILQEIAFLYLVAFAVGGFLVRKRAFAPQMVRYMGWGGAATLGLVVFVGLVALIGFDRLFLAFHLISFSNDLWLLDPSRDFLIAMFPEAFFFDATMAIAALTVLEALLLAAAPVVFLRWRPRWLRGAGRWVGRRAQRTAG